MADLITDTWNGLRVLKVSNEAAEAVIALHGAHVLSYKPAGEREVLWLSQESWHEAGKPIRGGIPVCWPWFGPAKEPAHGVARITEWALKNTVSDTAKTVLAFEAFAFENLIAEITITIADSLTLELSTTNLGAEEFRLTSALHSYFSISDIADIAISGLDKAEYLDTLTGTRHIQEEQIRFTAETDRIYDSSDAECGVALHGHLEPVDRQIPAYAGFRRRRVPRHGLRGSGKRRKRFPHSQTGRQTHAQNHNRTEIRT